MCLCGTYKREINLIVLSLDEGLPKVLANEVEPINAITIERLVLKRYDGMGIDRKNIKKSHILKRKKRVTKLIVANNVIAFQNEEKEKRSAEAVLQRELVHIQKKVRELAL